MTLIRLNQSFHSISIRCQAFLCVTLVMFSLNWHSSLCSSYLPTYILYVYYTENAHRILVVWSYWQLRTIFVQLYQKRNVLYDGASKQIHINIFHCTNNTTHVTCVLHKLKFAFVKFLPCTLAIRYWFSHATTTTSAIGTRSFQLQSVHTHFSLSRTIVLLFTLHKKNISCLYSMAARQLSL